MRGPIFPTPATATPPQPSPPPAPAELRCLGGRPAPQALLDDLRKASSLPAPAKQHLWELLGPCLGEANPPDIGARVARFCHEHGGGAEELGDAIGAIRHLIRHASAADMSRAELAEDLSRVPGGEELGEIVLPGYDAGKALVRSEIARQSIADHGKSLLGVDWRFDTISSSNRGERIGAQVVILTLHYQKGKREGQVTFHASPDAVRELRAACDRILA